MNNNKIIGIAGFVSLFCFIYTASLFAAVLSVLCWVLLVRKLLQTDAELRESLKQNELAYKELALLNPSAGTDIPETGHTCEAEREDIKCLIERKGMAKDVPEKACFVRKAPDQSPRRKIPIRSYRGEDIPGDVAARIEKKFPVIDAEIVDTATPVGPAVHDKERPSENTAGHMDIKSMPAETGDIYINEIPDGFSEEGYMETGLDSARDPEII